LSSAILYGAIVVIWAGVLIPRWLRRETSAEEATVTSDFSVSSGAPDSSESPALESSAPEPAEELDEARPRGSEHARVIAARRRLLGMLVALAIGAGVLAVMKLAAWWVVLPPSVMLIGYLALLREASRADAERRWAVVQRARAAHPAFAPVAAPVPVPAPDAEVIDITARVNDDLYDQIADAKLRAVGD
jgi:hypothetical protein